MGELASRFAHRNGPAPVLSLRARTRAFWRHKTAVPVCIVRDAAVRGWQCPVGVGCVLSERVRKPVGSFGLYTADELEMVELYSARASNPHPVAAMATITPAQVRPADSHRAASDNSLEVRGCKRRRKARALDPLKLNLVPSSTTRLAAAGKRLRRGARTLAITQRGRLRQMFMVRPSFFQALCGSG